MYTSTVFIQYDSECNNDCIVYQNVVALHRRSTGLVILTRTSDYLIENEHIVSISIVERTEIHNQFNFDYVSDTRVKPNFYEEDKTYV